MVISRRAASAGWRSQACRSLSAVTTKASSTPGSFWTWSRILPDCRMVCCCPWSDDAIPGLAHRAGDAARIEPFLEEDDQQDRRQRNHHGGRGELAPFDAELGEEHEEA